MKKYLLLATALAALVSCTSDDFTGNEIIQEVNENGNSAINFGTGVKNVTRADLTGAAAAEKLNDNFVFLGTKTTTSGSSIVFDHYNANWTENTANTTLSNSNDWEYVSYTPATTTSLPSGAIQAIKYWDYAASQYDFAAYSLGVGDDNDVLATASAINFGNLGNAVTGNPVYTLSGTVDQLKACYISDLVTHYNNTTIDAAAPTTFGKVVNFSFRSLAAKIRLAFYETVPGYSVKNIEFYTSNDANATLAEDGTEDNPTLFTGSGNSTLPSQAADATGKMKVFFPTVGWDNSPEKSTSTADTDYNKAHVTFAVTGSSALSSTMTFDELDDFANSDRMEAADEYLGRASNVATYAGGLVGGSGKYYTILPNENPENLMIRIKYTLVSTDGSAEEITVDNATAVIPAELANWHPNYAYTYIFKISDMTNGTTGVGPDGDPVMGLTPITLNAVVVDSEDGVQETITTVADPSITTYMAGKVVTENDEYIANGTHPIFIVVNNGSDNVTLSATNAKLYTATVQSGALQGITEESVDNALRYGVISGDNDNVFTVTDAAGKTLVVTEVGAYNETSNTGGLKSETAIPAAESPTGDAVTLACASFVPTAGTTYVFQYKGTATGAYGVYTAVEPGKLEAGETYYTSDTGAGEFVATGDEEITATNMYYTQVTSYAPVTGALTAAGTYYYYDSTSGNYVSYAWNGTDDVPVREGGYFTQVTSYKAVPFATLTAGSTYYTSDRGAGKFVATGSEVIDAENKYWTESTAEVDGGYMYKIIKVAD